MATVAAATGIALFAGTAPAYSAPSSSPSEFENHLRSVWTAHDVPSDTQSDLIASLESGQALEAQMQTEEPVTVDESRQDGVLEQVQRYSDGSINVVKLDLEATTAPTANESGEGVLLPMAIRGCTTSWSPSVTTYRNCTAEGWFTGVHLSGLVNVDSYIPSTKIVKTWAPTINCTGVTCTPPTWTRHRTTGTNSAPAKAELTTYWTYAGVASGTTRLIVYSRPGNHVYTN